MAHQHDGAPSHDQVEGQIQEVIFRLHQIMIQVSAYDTAGKPSRDVLSTELKSLSSTLSGLTISLSASSSPPFPSSPPPKDPTVSNGTTATITATTTTTTTTTAAATTSTATTTGSPPDQGQQQQQQQLPPPSRPLPSVPRDLIEYVENSRNPDIYTREFVELARRWNQIMRGKLNGFAEFRDVLMEQICAAMPELRDDARTVVESVKKGVPFKEMRVVGGGGSSNDDGGTGSGPGAAGGETGGHGIGDWDAGG